MDIETAKIINYANFALDYIKENPGCHGTKVIKTTRELFIEGGESDPKISGMNKALEHLIQTNRIKTNEKSASDIMWENHYTAI